MTPTSIPFPRRSTCWSYEEVYSCLKNAGLNSVPGNVEEILVDECVTSEWIEAMEAASNVRHPMNATIIYSHIENQMNRVQDLDRIRSLQDQIDNTNEFVPLLLVHPNTLLYERGMVSGSASRDEDELMIAVSRLYLDNIDHVQ